MTKRLADEKPEVRFPVTFDFPPWRADKINKLSRYSNWKAINIAFSAIRIISYRIQRDGEVGVTKKGFTLLKDRSSALQQPRSALQQFPTSSPSGTFGCRSTETSRAGVSFKAPQFSFRYFKKPGSPEEFLLPKYRIKSC